MPHRSSLPLLGFLACTLFLFGCEGKRSSSSPHPATSYDPGKMPSPMMAPGIRNPPVVAGKEAKLADDTPVVGVVVGNKARAYTLKALSHMQRHVVNDLLDKVPVSVTYCDLVDCLRVLTSDTKGHPLDIDQMGRMDGLMLRSGSKIFLQKTLKGENGQELSLPFKDYPHTRTTWKKWLAEHPDSDVYLGLEDQQGSKS